MNSEHYVVHTPAIEGNHPSSPLPWSIACDGGYAEVRGARTSDGSYNLVFPLLHLSPTNWDFRVGDVERIVRSVNNHDALVQALSEAFDYIAAENRNEDLIRRLDAVLTRARAKVPVHHVSTWPIREAA
jgi:hypothetical protein